MRELGGIRGDMWGGILKRLGFCVRGSGGNLIKIAAAEFVN